MSLLAPADRDSTRGALYRVIFGHDSFGGKAFDVALIVAIVGSVIAVMADSVVSVHAAHAQLLQRLEWGFTVLFSVEYALRLYCVRRPFGYARSFFGVIDLASILPSYLSLFIPGSQYLVVIRILRVLRVFRILKLAEYVGDADVLLTALRASRRKISIFIATVITLAVVLGSLMYLVEGTAAGFTSIPRSIYWTIVTITTVGYGDIAPKSPLGQSIATVVMLLGYAIIAVPTGIVTVELAQAQRGSVKCPACDAGGHAVDARFCYRCGATLPPPARHTSAP